MQIFFLIATIVISNLYTVDDVKYSMKIFESIMSSGPVCWYSNYIVGPITKKISRPGDELASEEYQNYGDLAQRHILIPENRRVPVKKMSLEYSQKHSIQASADPTGIYVNEEQLNKLSPIYRWYSSLHEASHHKFNHSALPFILLPLVGGMIIFDMPLKFLMVRNLSGSGETIRTIFNSALLYYITRKFLFHSNLYMEHHADIHALNHLGCFKCAEIVASTRGNNLEVNDRGYLNQDDILKFATKFKANNSLCEYHIKKINEALPQ